MSLVAILGIGVTVFAINQRAKAIGKIDQLERDADTAWHKYDQHLLLEPLLEATHAKVILERRKKLLKLGQSFLGNPNQINALDQKIQSTLSHVFSHTKEKGRLWHDESVYSAEFSRDGQLIVTASADKTAKIWKRDGTRVATLEGHQESVFSAEFSPDSQLIVTASGDKTAKIWKRDGQEWVEWDLNDKNKKIEKVAFSKDSQYAVITINDVAEVWNLQNQKKVATLDGHSFRISSVEFSPNSQLILTTSRDRTTKLWNLEGDLLASLSHESRVRTAQFSEDSQSVLIVLDTGEVKIWQIIDWTQLLPKACDRINNFKYYLENHPEIDDEKRKICDGVEALEE
ncbi:MAG: WD40 repeat domain-containing protein [Cyanobacteria bacterium J06592_8]